MLIKFGCFDSTSPPISNPPTIMITGEGRQHRDFGVGRWIMPNGKFQIEVPSQGNSEYEYDAFATSAVARDTQCTILTDRQISNDNIAKNDKILRRWLVNSAGYWTRAENLEMQTIGFQDIACSPNGRYVAFTESAVEGKSALRLADWQSRKVTNVGIVVAGSRHVGKLACGDDGTIYVREGEDLKSTDSSIVRYSSTGARTDVGPYWQVVTNRSGVFGVHVRDRYGCLQIDITNLLRPTDQPMRFSYMFARLSSTFPFIPHGTIAQLICSDDSQLWAAKFFGDSASWLVRDPPRAIVIWQRGAVLPVYVRSGWDNELKYFRPLAISAIDKPAGLIIPLVKKPVNASP